MSTNLALLEAMRGRVILLRAKGRIGWHWRCRASPIVVQLVVLVGVVVVVGEGVKGKLEHADGLLVTLQGTDERGDITRRN